jgi:hypothetical protein
MTTPSPDVDATTPRVDIDPRYVQRRVRDGQFAPGTMVAGRYQIGGILGKGGMGEVYRAEDIKLDQAVALKFLPARLARDPVLLSRLHDEVRLGRQVSHPNVCRIYDIVEADGAHFVAMELIDGEDLARLQRRIGRLAHDKAVDLSRGIAAGLTIFVAVRYGLLALMAFDATHVMLNALPALTGVSWAAPLIAIPFVVLAALALWAFRISVGNNSLFGTLVESYER